MAHILKAYKKSCTLSRILTVMMRNFLICLNTQNRSDPLPAGDVWHGRPCTGALLHAASLPTDPVTWAHNLSKLTFTVFNDICTCSRISPYHIQSSLSAPPVMPSVVTHSCRVPKLPPPLAAEWSEPSISRAHVAGPLLEFHHNGLLKRCVHIALKSFIDMGASRAFQEFQRLFSAF